MTDPTPRAKPVTIDARTPLPLSALLLKPRKARACFVLAHGAGAGMTHTFMEGFAVALYRRGIATLRYQFPFMQSSSKRPDSPAIAHAAVRAAVAEAHKRCRGLCLVAGGKSFGGRMTSQAQSIQSLDGVEALAFLGFPLHPSGKPAVARADHLSRVELPMLFIQGTRDKLAEPELLASITSSLGQRATVELVDQADHGFHVPVRSGRNDDDVVSEMADAFSNWLDRVVAQ